MHKYKFFTALAVVMLSTLTFVSFAEGTSTDRMSIERINKNEISKENNYTIKMSYPAIKNIPHGEDLNKLIQHNVDEIVISLKKNINNDKTVQAQSGLPLNENSNSIDINYKTTSATRDAISIRFSIYSFFYGAAHPLTTYQSLNYDLNQGKELSLKDLFKDPNYLSFIASYSKKILTKKLSKAGSPVKPDMQGIKPVDENYKVWNVTPQGLLITFPPYQVAAYVFGPQEVLIPYTELKPMLKMDLWRTYHS